MSQRLIATHNSVTGERGRGLLSWLVAPFSKCQGKTLKEQYDAGCRYFDIRVFKDKDGVWRCGHGLWTARKGLSEVWSEIRAEYPDAYYSITIEKGGEAMYKEFRQSFPFSIEYDGHERQRLAYIAVKHPKWMVMEEFPRNPFVKPEYMILDGSTWHTYLPIPWLWKKVYHDRPEFNFGYFKMVDFL